MLFFGLLIFGRHEAYKRRRRLFSQYHWSVQVIIRQRSVAVFAAALSSNSVFSPHACHLVTVPNRYRRHYYQATSQQNKKKRDPRHIALRLALRYCVVVDLLEYFHFVVWEFLLLAFTYFLQSPLYTHHIFTIAQITFSPLPLKEWTHNERALHDWRTVSIFDGQI